MTGKPYSGKLNVRFDEGELEIGQCHYASSLLYPYLSFDPIFVADSLPYTYEDVLVRWYDKETQKCGLMFIKNK